MAAKDQTTDLDWELVHRSSTRWMLQNEPYDLDMVGPEGRLAGPAILVSSDGHSHVFRGVGHLDGFPGFAGLPEEPASTDPSPP